MKMRLTCPHELEAELIRRAGFLGYCVALSRVTRVPGAGSRLSQGRKHSGRVLRGEYRVGDDLVRYEPIWTSDEERRASASPHRREFLLDVDGFAVRSMARRRYRRLSVCDARLLLNLARLDEGATVLDPYAGIGGIVLEARQRGLRTICGDVDPALRLGLAELSGGLAAVWDATMLPLRDCCCDAVVTEPPYLGAAHGAVVVALPELARCVRPGGRLSMLVTRELGREVLRAAHGIGLVCMETYELRREGCMVCDAVVLQRRE
ncbi:MAG: hypothetical protein HPY44_04920 [Armatimonadetes bacterium]|nr:hypothetical protein [Armatimonadota bacterium]